MSAVITLTTFFLNEFEAHTLRLLSVVDFRSSKALKDIKHTPNHLSSCSIKNEALHEAA